MRPNKALEGTVTELFFEELKGPWLVRLNVDQDLNPLRDDPRDVLLRMKLEPSGESASFDLPSEQ